MHVRLSKSFEFEAAHHLPTFPEGHKCRRPHGHRFRIDVCVEGEVDEARGYLIDYGELKAACAPLCQQLDHAYLNEIDGLAVPTAENLARWLWERLRPHLPLLSAVVVYESPNSACEYRGE